MDPVSVVSLILGIMLVVERCFKHVKKSKCCGMEIDTYADTDNRPVNPM